MEILIGSFDKPLIININLMIVLNVMKFMGNTIRQLSWLCKCGESTFY